MNTIFYNALTNTKDNPGSKLVIDPLAPYLTMGHHTKTLFDAAKHGVRRIGNEPIYHCVNSTLSQIILDQATVAYKFVSQLFDSKPAVLIGLLDENKSPFCIRITEDMGCVFVSDSNCITSVLVHEFAHLCCMSGHPIFDEGVAYFSEVLFEKNRGFSNIAPCDFSEACSQIHNHSDLFKRGTEWQMSFGKASSRIISSLHDQEISLVLLSNQLKQINPGKEFEKFLQNMVPNLNKVWNFANVDKNKISHCRGTQIDELDSRSDSFSNFYEMTVKLFQSNLYTKEVVEFAIEHAMWHKLANTIIKSGGEQSALAQLYYLIDGAVGGKSDKQFEWINIETYLDKVLKTYPRDPRLAAAALFFWSRIPSEGSSQKINELISYWKSDHEFGDQLKNLAISLGLLLED